MSEVLHISTNDPEPSAPTPEQEALLEERQAALDKAASFLRDQIPSLRRLTGMDVYVTVGKKWATNLKTGSFTIDPSFFIEKGYSADHCVFATLHELMAHVRDVKHDPALQPAKIRSSWVVKIHRNGKRAKFLTIS